jgi:2-hydroxy-6-oxonona-2,4-dienedioate hydrolase
MPRDRFESIWSDLQGVAFSQGYVDAGGIRTRYLHAGDRSKPALVFLHGTGGHAEAYVRNLAAHGEHFSTWAIDMLGHGHTDKPDWDYAVPRYVEHLAAFLDTVGVERTALSGESLGGWVASHFAVARPERITRLVLNTAGGDQLDPGTLERIRETTMAAVDDPAGPRLRARLEWLMYDKSQVHEDLVESRCRIYSAPGMKRAMAHILSMHTLEARQRYALTAEQWSAVRAPVLVLWTSHDPTAPVSVGERLTSMIPGARLVVMQNCGHWPQFEDAETFNRLHLDFLLGRD